MYQYKNLQLNQEQFNSSGTLEVRLDVANIGTHNGEEVVQLYVSAIGSKVERAPKELKAFARVGLNVGETKQVAFALPISQLAYYDETQAKFVVEPIEYELFIGTHSLDTTALKARFVVQG